MYIKYLISFAVALTPAGVIEAQSNSHVGNFICNECSLSYPMDGDTLAFIRSTVNHHVNTWVIPGTNRGKTVTICNAGWCATYKYLVNGNFLRIFYLPMTNHGGNPPPPIDPYTPGHCTYEVIRACVYAGNASNCSYYSYLECRN